MVQPLLSPLPLSQVPNGITPRMTRLPTLMSTLTKTPKIEKKSTRPKAGDYHDSQKELVLTAANIYRVLLASRGPFPNTATEVKLIKKAWKLMNDESGLKARPLTPSIITIVSIATTDFFLYSLLLRSKLEALRFEVRPKPRLPPL